MARLHSGGFINEAFYFNIGTEDARGRDGDTARLAAQKYNDHRHSAFIAVSEAGLFNWVNELQDVSVESGSGNPGGILNSTNSRIRSPGDTAELNSVIYMMTSNGVRSITSGFGPHLGIPADPTQDPTIDADYVCSNYPMLRTPAPVTGTPCVSADDGNGIFEPVSITVGSCIIYPTIHAGSGELFTQVGVAAAVRADSTPEIVANGQSRSLTRAPLISIALKIKRFEYNALTRRITSTVSIPSDPVRITSITGSAQPSFSNSSDVGLTLATVLDIPGNFVGKIELEMVFDVDACYSIEDYINEAQDLGISEEDLKSQLSAWAGEHLFLDLADATARVLCRFGGE